jgi:hypothetical protein
LTESHAEITRTDGLRPTCGDPCSEHARRLSLEGQFPLNGKTDKTSGLAHVKEFVFDWVAAKLV